MTDPTDPNLTVEPIDEETGRCRYCGGRADPARDWREWTHEQWCPWLLAGKATDPEQRGYARGFAQGIAFAKARWFHPDEKEAG